jgi:hypothetical protein
LNVSQGRAVDLLEAGKAGEQPGVWQSYVNVVQQRVIDVIHQLETLPS